MIDIYIILKLKDGNEKKLNREISDYIVRNVDFKRLLIKLNKKEKINEKLFGSLDLERISSVEFILEN